MHVLIEHRCNTFLVDQYPCSEPDIVGATLYENVGMGWSTVYEDAGTQAAGTTSFPSDLVGLADGRIALVGGQCAVLLVNADGSSECALDEAVFVRDVASADDRLYALVGDGISGGPQEVREHADGSWRTLVTLPAEETANAVGVAGSTLAVSGADQFVLSGDVATDTYAPLPAVPAGSYPAIWVDAPNRIAIGNRVGHVAQYDGADWNVVDTGISDVIVQLWGASDGTLYFLTQSHVGRVVAGSAEILTPPEASSASHYFVNMWGASAREVFFAVNDRGFGVYECGATFLLWFDGSTFHQF